MNKCSSSTLKKVTVIALATKLLPGLDRVSVNEISRDAVETELNFLGLLVMENKMKP